jgi:predicted nucleotidyltransferase
MTEVEDNIGSIIRDIAETIVQASDPDRIIVFGSAARGDPGPDSDVDILVVEKESSFQGGDRWNESCRIRKALRRFPVSIDVLLFTPEEVEKWKHSTNHVIARSVREGRVLYDRP